MAKFNIPSLLEQAFGFKRDYVIPLEAEPVSGGEFTSIDTQIPEDRVGISQIGTAVLDRLVFLPGKTFDGTPYPQFTTPDVVLIDASLPKVIVKTPIAGGSGDVKELIGMSDWQIRIRGIILDPEPRYPHEMVEKLRRLCEVPSAIEVSSRYFATIGIDYLVIENLSLPANEKFVNGQPYVITASSDRAPELKLKEEI